MAEEVDLADFQVVPRPHELIAAQLKLSAGKSKAVKERSVSGSKGSSHRKESKKSKDKSSAHKEKGLKSKSGKKRLPTKSISSHELENKFESFLRSAKHAVSKHKSSGHESEKFISPKADENEQQLMKILEEPAFTAQERLEVLNARDKLIRLRESKKDSSQAKKITGFCPDMCPEKERYSRIAKNCLSVLELKSALDSSITSRDVEHAFMVKEYSRSSADQQEPLPHELRPVSVLSFTMDHLICNLMNVQLDNISIGDWFDFIWNRTRSLRKDITQQQLCDIKSVEIIEKCVRFHIHCAEALSEEDAAIFDPKINNENLTKCLQTLKHMYHDLLSRGVKCPNEAEFRAYDILLSLTEGETLRLVKDIRKELLKSQHLKSAFEAALAFKSHNYVKFFKLLEKATYLSSCILHRYVNEARIRALQIIVRAYSTKHQSCMYPTSSLVKDLKFDSPRDACDFCKWYGLRADELEIEIERKSFCKPVSPFPITRSVVLVGKKLNTSVGEVICNSPLPQNPLQWYRPHNSFNEKGLLQKGSILAVDQQRGFAGTKVNQNISKSDQISVSESPCLPKDALSKLLTPIPTPAPAQIGNERVAQKDLFRKPEISFLKFQHQAEGDSLLNNSSNALVTEKTTFSNKSALPYSRSHRFSHASSGSDTSKKSRETFSFKSPDHESQKKKNLKTNKLNVKNQFSTPNSIAKGKHSKSSSSTKNYFEQVELKPLAFSFTNKHLSQVSSLKPAPAIESDECAPDVVLPIAAVTDKNSEYSVMTDSVHDEQVKSDFVPFDLLTTDDDNLKDAANTAQSITKLSQEAAKDFSSQESSLAESKRLLCADTTEKDSRNLDDLFSAVADEVFTQYIEEFSNQVSEDIFNEEYERKVRLDSRMEERRNHLARHTIYKWRLFCERKKQRNIYQNSVPLSPMVPMLINTEYITSGARSPFAVYKKHIALSHLSAAQIKKRNQQIINSGHLTAANFSSTNKLQNFPSAYLRNTGISKFFKIYLVFASYQDVKLSLIIEWMKFKFRLSEMQDIHCKKSKLLRFCALDGGKAIICVQAITLSSYHKLTCSKGLAGVSGMILCFPTRFQLLEDFKAVLNAFSSLLNGKSIMTQFPLSVLLVTASEGKYNVEDSLVSFLDEKINSSRIFSAVRINRLADPSKYTRNSDEVLCSLNWLFENHESLPLLQNCSFRDYMEDTFASAFNILYWKLSIEEFKLIKQMPQHIIAFYNRVLTSKSMLLTSDLLCNVAAMWPPEELLLIQPDYRFIEMTIQEECKHLMKQSFLPEFVGDPNCKNDMWQYIQKVADFIGSSSIMLFLSVKNLLKNMTDVIDWPLILSKCAYYLLDSHHSKSEHFTEHTMIYYMKEDLDAISYDDFWKSISLPLRLHMNSMKRKVPVYEFNWDNKKNKMEMPRDSFSNPNDKFFKNFSGSSDVLESPFLTNTRANVMLANLQEDLKKQEEESEKFLNKLNESVDLEQSMSEDYEQRLATDTVQKNFLKQDVRSLDISSLAEVYKQSPTLNESFTSSYSSRGSLDFKGSYKNLPAFPTPSSISEKLSELQYNMQKSRILEDRLSFLLES